ncbi:MAG: SGNH/GDSL hydrolase family protein [Candidatus Omnitrophica bacterium]|nr:SGNH/GDSL hydrolase family protein [Candidatus Omnitrophota bacterium]
MKKIVVNITVFIFSICFILLVFEGALRFYNSDGKNYDIEMWKYGKYLKRKSQNINIAIEHIPLKKYWLQNVEIAINSAGFRDREYLIPKPKNTYRIIVLGSSITLGWGVSEGETYASLVENRLNGKTGITTVEIINTAVGNYNTIREIETFFDKCLVFEPDMVIISFFINDPEILQIKKSNCLLRNSQLAVLLWSRYHQIIRRIGLKDDYVEHYEKLYSDDYKGWGQCQQAMSKLSVYCKKNNIEVLLTLLPEIHDLQDYPFGHIHRFIKEKAVEFNFSFLDFYDVLKDVEAGRIWAMPGDPHPNKEGHLMITESLYAYLMQNKPWEDKFTALVD